MPPCHPKILLRGRSDLVAMAAANVRLACTAQEGLVVRGEQDIE